MYASNDIVAIAKPFSCIVNMIAVIYLICEFGERVTSGFSELSGEMYDVLWYLYPTNEQKSFILMIQNANKPAYVEGYFVQSTRDSFKRVKTILALFRSIYVLIMRYFVFYLFPSLPIMHFLSI